MKKILSLLAMAMVCTYATAVYADAPTTLQIDVPTPGTLQTLMPVDQAAMVGTLKVNGYLNTTDISYLKTYTPMLANLDMSNVTYCVNTTPNNSFQSNSFNGKTSLVRVQMPKHITNIYSYAFNGCTALQRIILPDSLRLIDHYAFQGCPLLDSVIIPQKVYYLGECCFQSCTSLQSITLPKNLTSWYNYTFRYCTGLKTAIVADTMTTIPHQSFYGCSSLKQVHLPARLTSIASYAFYNCFALDSIAFPVTLTSIDYQAFYYCTSLKSAILPNNMSSMSSYVFYNCSSLETVRIPLTMTNIPENSFYNCTSLKNLTLPNNLLSIGSSAFYNCVSLKKLKLPNNVLQSINSYAFQYCSSLDTLYIPSSVTSINYYAFSYCYKLKMVKLSDNMSVINEGLFRDCVALDSIVYPVGLTAIGHNAFYNCYSLTGQLIIPLTLTSVGSQSFYNCGYRSCKSLPTTPPSLYSTSNSLWNIKFAFVPAASTAAYKSSWSGIQIIGGDSLITVDVTLTSAGTLGAAILEKVAYLKDVNKLTVSGPMNTADLSLIKQSMPSIISLNLKNAQLTQIPDYQFQYNALILEIVLPDVLESIGYMAFYNCSNLRSLIIPDKVTSFSDQQFDNCTNLESIILPKDLTNLGSYTFRYCYKLKSIVIPPKVRSINYQDFYSCTNLNNVVLPDSLTYVAPYAFYDCDLKSLILPANLTNIEEYAFMYNDFRSVILPAKLQSVHYQSFSYNPLDSITFPPNLNYIEQYAFGYCNSLKKVTCNQSIPPVLSYDPFVGLDVSKIALTVPSWSSTMYKVAYIWSNFYPINTFNTEVKDITLNGRMDLYENTRFVGSPNVTIQNQGGLTVRGNAPMTTDRFTLDFTMNYTKYWWGGGDFPQYFGLLNSECPAFTANKVQLRMDVYGDIWYFLTFPFDVPVSGLKINNNSQFVFRKYDGAIRAFNSTGNSWKNMTPDSVLKAGEGYIYQCSENSQLILVPTDSTKNQLFTSTARNTVLKEYASTSLSDKNWNFVGNPFPTFYDIRYIDFTAPITVWDYYNSTYRALSLVDDQFVLKPYEAFFVQKPEDLTQISFLPKGRQMSPEYQAALRSAINTELRSATDRRLINLNLSNDKFTDKCRVVINPNASLTYELARDASKFMSSQTTVPQLYSLDETGVRYAINERPLESGTIKMGCYFGEAGTYTLHATDLGIDAGSVVLNDKLLQKQTVLNESSYTFSTVLGTFNNRFELSILNVPTQNQTTEELPTSVWCTTGKLNISTKVGNKISIYAVNGILLKEFVANEKQLEIALSQGVYLVKVAGNSFKSVVF